MPSQSRQTGSDPWPQAAKGEGRDAGNGLKPSSDSSLLYLLVRVLVTVGAFLRFYLHGIVGFSGVLGMAWLCWVGSCLGAYLLFRLGKKVPRRLSEFVVLFDIVSISLFYRATGTAQSDLYLFYCLPFLTAVEWSRARGIVVAAVLSSIAFGTVAFLMPESDGQLRLFLRVFVPREVFYFGITLILALRLRRERDARERSSIRRQRMQELLEARGSLEHSLKATDMLERVVSRAAKGAGLDHAVGLLRLSGSIDAIKAHDRRGPCTPDPDVLEACRAAASGNFEARAEAVTVHGRIVGAIGARASDPEDQDAHTEYLKGLAEQVASASEQVELFQALRQIGAAASTVVALNEELEAILDEVEKLGFQHATISLVDEYMGRIRAVRGRNVPPGWLARAQHNLAEAEGESEILDIQSDIVRTGNTEIPEDDDVRLDRDMFDYYHHERLARVFAPITSGGKVIGTIEAGCQKAQREEILDEVSHHVSELGRVHGESIAGKMPHVLLELVARHAVQLVGADSASVHVFRGDWTRREELLLAGVGAGMNRDFLRTYPPRDGGLGQAAVTARVPQVDNDLAASQHPLVAAGIHAVAAFPLQLGERVFGILYVHYASERRFAQAEVELVDVLVPQIEIAIQNHLLFHDISRADDHLSVNVGLQNVLRLLSSPMPLERLLQQLAENALYMLDAQNVTLYQYFANERRFEYPVIGEGIFLHRELLRMQVEEDDIVHSIVKSGAPRFISNVREADFLLKPRSDSITRERFAEREKLESCVVLPLKAPDGEVVGCLFANYTHPLNFDGDEQHALKNLAVSVASAVAIVIKSTRLSVQAQRDLQRKTDEIEALRAINRSIVKTARHPDLGETCGEILHQALRVLEAKVGDVTIWKPTEKRLDIVTQVGYPNGAAASVKLGEGVVGLAGKLKQTEWHNDVRTASYYRGVHPDTRSELAVAMLDQGEHDLLGVINVEHEQVGKFGQGDVRFLETLAIQGAIAVHSVYLYRQLQRQLQEALSLSTIAAKIQDLQSEPDRALSIRIAWRLLLAGLTADEGLGFSRAMVFETDHTSRELRGLMGVGAITRAEAESTWKHLETERRRIQSERGTFLEWLLNDVEALARGVAAGERDDSNFSRLVQRLSLNFSGLTGIDFDASSSGSVRPVPFGDEAQEAIRKRLQPLYEDSVRAALACAPIKGKSGLVGVIIVDRSFLHDEHVIDPLSEPILSAFAELAAISIESLKVQAALADEQQLRNWRYATHKISHMLKAKITSMQQRTNAILNYLDTGQSNLAEQALVNVKSTVNSTSDILDDFDRFARPAKLSMGDVDLQEVLENLVNDARADGNCCVELDCSPNLMVQADRARVPELFADLVQNAKRALHDNATQKPVISIQARSLGEFVEIDVCDNGPGVAAEVEARIFEPFISKYKSSGLGLAIIRDLVELHNGQVTYRRLDPGACFTIQLRRAANSAGTVEDVGST